MTATIVLAGEIDAGSSTAIQRFLLATIRTGDVRLVIDLSAVTFLGFAGICALIAADSAAREVGGCLELQAHPELTGELPGVLRRAGLLHDSYQG